ncbi:MAG: NAD(P)H-binding protein [Thermaerobacter sp.]|nr:NAD(P)H-binding protein [Thermaerobacter sp.]
MRFLVAGASGFLGTAVQAVLVAEGHQVRAVSRSGRAAPGAEGVACNLLGGNISGLLAGVDGVLNLVGVLREDAAAGMTYRRVHVELAKQLARAAASVGVPRFVQLSSLGAAQSRASRYFASKRAAEDAVQATLPRAVVVRSSVVFGDGAPLLTGVSRLARLPVVPVPGDGRTPFDPIARHDVAALLAAVLAEDREEMAGQVLSVGGPRRLTLDDLVDWAARIGGRRGIVPKMHVPVALVDRAAAVGDVWPGVPVNRAQVHLLTTPNITEDRRWHRWVPHPAPAGED